MKEREISLVDFIFEILLKWRIIIIAMLIGGVVFYGYNYLKLQENQNQNVLIDAEIFAGLEEKLTEEEKARVKATLGYLHYSEYYNESLLMQIDGNNAPTTELVFSIKASDEKTEAAIVGEYEKLFETGISEWLVQNGMDTTEANKVNELIITEKESVIETTVGENQYAPNLKEQNVATGIQVVHLSKESQGSLYVRVVHVDETQCKELANQVTEYVLLQEKYLEDRYGACDVSLVSETYATVIDKGLLNSQMAVVLKICDGIEYADILKTAFTSEQKQYYNLLEKGVTIAEDEESVPTPAPIAVSTSPYASIKTAFIGMILFAAIYVFYLFTIYIFNNKLRTGDDLTKIYGISQLGTIAITNEKKKFLGFIDAWILALRDRNKRKFTLEEVKEISAVAVKMAMKKTAGKEVYFIGCDIKKNSQNICADIKNILEKEDIKVNVLDNVLYNAEEMEKLSDAKCAVLIEKTGSTLYQEVEKELELLARYDITVLGCILVD